MLKKASNKKKYSFPGTREIQKMNSRFTGIQKHPGNSRRECSSLILMNIIHVTENTYVYVILLLKITTTNTFATEQ